MKNIYKNLDFKWIDSKNTIQKIEFIEALEAYIFFKKKSINLTSDLILKYPDFIAPKILMMSLLLLSRDKSNNRKANEILIKIKSSTLSLYLKEYLSIMYNWIQGNIFKVSNDLKVIIKENPKDIYAIRLFHFNCIFTGIDKNFLKDHKDLIQYWSHKDYYYNLILGMTSFAYEENNNYIKAMELADLSLNISKKDLWSWHALLHINDSNLDSKIKFNKSFNEVKWNSYGPIKRHLWWHQALLYYYKKDFNKCLEMYDDFIFSKDEYYLDFCNTSSLLLRLNLKKIDVRTRMDKLKPIANYFKNQNILPFIDFHLFLFYKYYEDQNFLNTFAQTLHINYKNSYFKDVYNQNLKPLIDNIFNNKNLSYDIIEQNFVGLGGSFAQREIILLNIIKTSDNKVFKNKIMQQIQNKKNTKHLIYV